MKFEYEESLDSKGLKVADLPSSITDKIKKFNALCRDLNNTEDDDLEKQTELNQQIDSLDTEMSKDIEGLTVEDPKPSGTDDPKPNGGDNTSDENAEKSNDGLAVVAFGAVALAIAYGVKRMMGK